MCNFNGYTHLVWLFLQPLFQFLKALINVLISLYSIWAVIDQGHRS